ncbi:MAG: hypothetical protein HYX78_10885 [Armatimonadetes bacterium]|nr:hypothetical protein [Armatimonadota bacterium]
MNQKLLIEKWLNNAPIDESVDVVKSVLLRFFGSDAICKGTGDSHQLRVKHPALRDLPGFGQFGHLSIPVTGGRRVKGYYLRRIAQAIKHLEEIEKEEKGK